MAGRGRGRASTLPAWMTKQNEAGPNGGNPPVASAAPVRPPMDNAPVHRGQFDDAPEPRRDQGGYPRRSRSPPRRSPPRDQYRGQDMPPRMPDRRGMSPQRPPANYGVGGDQFNQRPQPYYGDVGNQQQSNGGGGYRGHSPMRGGNGFHPNDDGYRRGDDRRWQQDSRQQHRSRSRSRERGQPWDNGRRGPPDSYRGGSHNGRSRSRSRSRERRQPQYNQDYNHRGRNDWERGRGHDDGGWRGAGNDDHGRRRDGYDRRDQYNGRDTAYTNNSNDRYVDDSASSAKPSGFLSGRRFGDIVKDAARSAAEEYSSKDATEGDASRSGGHDDRTRRDYRRR